MKKKTKIILGILAFLVIVSFLNQCLSKNIVCDEPYIRFEKGCCLDENDNKICDEDETGIVEEETESLKFTVSRVIDGDTFVLDSEEKVRLIGIDTPETYENYYTEAKERLEELVLNKEVSLEKDTSETDKYGRLLRYVYVGDTFINELLVEEGWAQAYPYKPDTKYKETFELAETNAKLSNLGIWHVEEQEEEQETDTPEDSEQTETTQTEEETQEQTTTTPTSNYVCSSDTYNCGDFDTHAEAQAVFEDCGGVSNDVHKLDRDNDGIACESLP